MNAKAHKEAQLLAEIATLRRKNNNFWMQIVAIALDKSPEQVKPLMRVIGEIDGEVTRRWKELSE